jgi:hypothetical protein
MSKSVGEDHVFVVALRGKWRITNPPPGTHWEESTIRYRAVVCKSARDAERIARAAEPLAKSIMMTTDFGPEKGEMPDVTLTINGQDFVYKQPGTLASWQGEPVLRG